MTALSIALCRDEQFSILNNQKLKAWINLPLKDLPNANQAGQIMSQPFEAFPSLVFNFRFHNSHKISIH